MLCPLPYIPHAALCAVQDPYVSLRSAHAGGMFLQARRKPPSLGFFSMHAGVWEQWEVGGGGRWEGDEGGDVSGE